MGFFYWSKIYGFLHHRILIDGLESCRLLLDYYVFISCFNFHSDSTVSLTKIH